MGTYNGTFTSTVTLTPGQANTTLGATGLMNAYGPAGTYAIDLNHTVTSETFSAALFGPAGTVLAFGYRGDLREASIGKGRAAFSFDAPPGGRITVHCAADGTALPLTDACQMRLTA